MSIPERIRRFLDKTFRSPPPPGDLSDNVFALGRSVTETELAILTRKFQDLASNLDCRAFEKWFLHHFYPGDQSHIAFKVRVAMTVDLMCGKIIRNCRICLPFRLIMTFDSTAYLFRFSINPGNLKQYEVYYAGIIATGHRVS